MRALVAGWFSFEEMGATAGDLLNRDLVCDWLAEAGIVFDVALAPPFPGGVRWDSVEPADYSHLVFVCGPFGNGWPITELLPRFSHCQLVGVNLSMLQPLDEWNPFDVLLERDSSRTARPDLALLSRVTHVPVVGLVLVHHQAEYADSAHEAVEVEITGALSSRDLAVVPIDTRLDANAVGLTTPAQVETLIARMDVVVTTRLHGLVLALKNGVPVVAIDPTLSGAKVARQADVLGWPAVYRAEAIDQSELARAIDFCLTEEARNLARSCAAQATQALGGVPSEFLAGLAES